MKQRFLILSPLFVLGLGHVVARIAIRSTGDWAWVPVLLVYWCTVGSFIVWGKEPDALRRWLGPARGDRRWTVLAVLVGLIPLPILLLNIHLLAEPVVLVAWLAFALLNPWFEEGYWRGLLLDATGRWPRWASNLYSTSLFMLSHPLIGGLFAAANRDWMALSAIFVMGSVWAAAYQRTATLRWVVFSHVLVDLGNLAVPVFLGLYIPPHLA